MWSKSPRIGFCFVGIGVAAIVLLGGCDGAPVAPGDAGGGDAGTDAGPAPRALAFRVIDDVGAPIAGAHVALDAPSGRVETTSDAAGEVALEAAVTGGEPLDLTIADEAHVVLSFVGITADVIAETFADVTLPRLDPEIETTAISITVADLPADHRVCVGLLGGGPCAPAGVGTLPLGPPRARVGTSVRLFVLDATDAVVDFIEAPLTGDPPFTVSATFDGVPAQAPTITREVTIDLAAGHPDSALASLDPPAGWASHFGAYDSVDGQALGVFTQARREGTTLRGRYTGFHEEHTPRWELFVVADPRALHTRSHVYYGAVDPGAELAVLPTGTLTAGASRADELAFTRPVAEHDYLVALLDAGDDIVWLLRPGSATSVHVPDLPSGFDVEERFPYPGDPGSVVIISQSPDPSRPDVTLSPLHPFTF